MLNENGVQLTNQRKITALLMNVGIPVKSKGFEYIRRALCVSLERPEMLNSLTKLLYPEVARLTGTTASCVERNIRYALCTAWNMGGAKRFNNYIKLNVYNSQNITSGEFLAIATESILLGEL